jgi:RimJ/RimL family protein N-acetyltransferase
MKPLLRVPVETDYAILASWIQNAAACARWAGPNLQFPFVAQELQRLLHVDRNCSYALSEPDGALLGFAQFWPRNEKTVHLGRIIVAPLERGRGLGRLLVSLLVGEAILTTRPEMITLRVYRDNSAAIALYSKLGFVEVAADSNANVMAMEKKANPGAPKDHVHRGRS